MMTDGWAPLRWCLFVTPLRGYAGRPPQVEAVLANESVLPAGEYPVIFRIFGERSGKVWEREAIARIPDPAPGRPGPLAVPVLRETLPAGLPPDDYVFAAHLVRGATPRGDRLPFRIAEPEPARDALRVQQVGLEETALAWLAAHGVAAEPFAPGSAADRLLVGAVPGSALPAATWEALRDQAAVGATLIFLSAAPFLVPAGTQAPVLPLGDRVRARTFNDWLYHKEIVARPHPAFTGLPTGLLDWADYGQVWTHDLFDCADTPDEVLAASFAVGYSCPGGYDSGIIAALYRHGQGRIIVNSLRVLEELDRHPAADRMLLNLVHA
jgi:hypothetical protein